MIPLIDRDEPWFAKSALEMMQNRAWIVPTINGEENLHKPVLTYWLMSASYAAFGVSEFSARLHSVACAAALALVVYAMGRRLYSAQAGFAGAFGLLTCLQFLIHGRSAVADMPMVVCVATAQWALLELLTGAFDAYPWCWFALLYASLGIGFLAKGPIALLVPALTLILWRWVFGRRPLPWSRLKLPAGLAVVLSIIGAWGIPALIETQGRFWSIGIGEHVVERGERAFNGRPTLPFYYLFTSVLSLYPWSCYAPRALWRGWKARTQASSFLIAWFVAPYILFAFYATQLPHYVMPGYPALFLLFGTFVGAQPEHWERAWKGFVLGLGTLVAVAGLVLPRFLFAGHDVAQRVLTPVFLGFGILMIGLTLAATRLRWFAIPLLVAGILGIGYGLRDGLPAIHLRHEFASLPPQTEYACWAYREPSLLFYSGRNWQLLSKIEDGRDFLAKPGPRMLVVPEMFFDAKDIARGRWTPSKSFTNEIAMLSSVPAQSVTIRGFNIARSQLVDIRAFYKSE